MRQAEFLGNFQTINSPTELASLPSTFMFTETFQHHVTDSSPIGLFITDDVEVTKVDFSNNVLTLSTGKGEGKMVFMIHSSQFEYPFEVKNH